MSFMFEVFYPAPEDPKREMALVDLVNKFGGRLNFRELNGPTNESVCLAFEFEQTETANRAAQALRLQNEHVEGPYDY